MVAIMSCEASEAAPQRGDQLVSRDQFGVLRRISTPITRLNEEETRADLRECIHSKVGRSRIDL